MAFTSTSPIAGRSGASAFGSPDLSSFPFTKVDATQPPGLVERSGKRCPILHAAAFHTSTSCPDTNAGSERRTPATLYQVLEIPRTATEAEIKASYRRLARRYHPDVVAMEDKQACTKLFLQIHAAYSALSDVHSRASYDLQLSVEALQARRIMFSRAPDFNRTPHAGSTNSSARSPFSACNTKKGRSWETDQCWC